MKNIVIATIKEWNISNFFNLKELFSNSYNFILVTSKEELEELNLEKLSPKYIFFPHWSWIINEKIYKNYECVVFHMTDLPFGRGGSPLQNLIMNKVYDTKISAIKVNEEIDGGDIYLKEGLNIKEGSAQEIFINASKIVFEILIPKMLKSNIIPKKQVGESTYFKRRTPKESEINTLEEISLDRLYDFIRMLDGEGYPKAYLKLENMKIEFSQIEKKDNKLVGRFEVLLDE